MNWREKYADRRQVDSSGRAYYALTTKELHEITNPFRPRWRLAVLILAAPAGFAAARLLIWLISP